MHPSQRPVQARFREVLAGLVSKPVPVWMCFTGSDDLMTKVQDWVSANTALPWMTGIDTIEAAVRVVRGAMANDNLDSDGIVT